ncbi:hypothetical protein GR238_33760 [Rhizobium leguminosarum]|uniref:hypothetical protein n=1 Tax=Rhizobium ruizarguesonis TaxID=2081791 RepID=UPI0013B772BE|nr:hypothetical protein [Rhizobium ruizarguesonis]NEJ10334.1 hypothetical protein [Rhizobium ruizarguesonis]
MPILNPYRVQAVSPEEKLRLQKVENERTKLMAEALTNLGLLFVGSFLISPIANKLDFSTLGQGGTWAFIIAGMVLHVFSHYLLTKMS